jgi:hypothetical protein
MGGINHAPCNRYLAHSTRLSQSLTLARAQLDLANVELENVLLIELDGSVGDINRVIAKLDESDRALVVSMACAENLCREMKDAGYEDLEPLRDKDLERVGTELTRHGHVREGSWQRILTQFRNESFYGVLAGFQSRIRDIQKRTGMLRKKCEGLATFAETGDVNTVLEQNYKESLKPEFALLYTGWSAFMDDFLASSLISTEIWYRYSEYGSLLDHDLTPARATVQTR